MFVRAAGRTSIGRMARAAFSADFLAIAGRHDVSFG